MKHNKLKMKHIINEELKEMKTDKVRGKQMLRQWQANNSAVDAKTILIDAHRSKQRKSSSIMHYGSYIAAACLALVIGFTTISVASGKVSWQKWTNQMFSGNEVKTDEQEAKAIEEQKETVLNQNKSITIGKYKLQVQEYTMDSNGFFYLLITLKDDAGNDFIRYDLPLELYWADENGNHAIDAPYIKLTGDSKGMKESSTPYGYTVSGICPSLMNPKNKLVFMLDGACGDFTGISITEPANYKYSDKKSSLSFSVYGFLMNRNCVLNEKLDKIGESTTFVATYDDGTKDNLQISSCGGMHDKYETYLQFAPTFKYQKHANQKTVWDEENYRKLMYSLTNYKFDVDHLTKLTLEDGTVIFEKGKK